MKSKLLSLVLVLSLLMTSAVCSYAENSGSKGNSSKDKVTTTAEDQTDQTEKVKKDDGKAAVAAEKKAGIARKQEQIRSKYSNEDVEKVNAAAEKIKKEDPTAKVLGYDSIISDQAEFKFDTPPVIKSGRTLIPVRAITEGFGAELTYDQENHVVTITKGETVIELTLGSMTAVVNGKEVQMDTKANIMNSRTYVPLRFVLETFKLSVEWDKDTETVEINDGTETEPPEATTAGAITTGEATTAGAITTDSDDATTTNSDASDDTTTTNGDSTTGEAISVTE